MVTFSLEKVNESNEQRRVSDVSYRTGLDEVTLDTPRLGEHPMCVYNQRSSDNIASERPAIA